MPSKDSPNNADETPALEEVKAGSLGADLLAFDLSKFIPKEPINLDNFPMEILPQKRDLGFEEEPLSYRSLRSLDRLGPRSQGEWRYYRVLDFKQRLLDRNLFERSGDGVDYAERQRVSELLEKDDLRALSLEIELIGRTKVLNSKGLSDDVALKAHSLLVSGKFEEAEQLAEAFEFSDAEKQAILVAAVAHELDQSFEKYHNKFATQSQSPLGTFLGLASGLDSRSIMGVSPKVALNLVKDVYETFLRDLIRRDDEKPSYSREDYHRSRDFDNRQFSPVAEAQVQLIKALIPPQAATEIDRKICTEICTGRIRSSAEIDFALRVIHPSAELLGSADLIATREDYLRRHITTCRSQYGHLLIEDILTHLRLDSEILGRADIRALASESYQAAYAAGNVSLMNEYKRAFPEISSGMNAEGLQETQRQAAISIAKRGAFVELDQFIAETSLIASQVINDDFLGEHAIAGVYEYLGRVQYLDQEKVTKYTQSAAIRFLCESGRIDPAEVDKAIFVELEKKHYEKALAIVDGFYPERVRQEKKVSLLLSAARNGDQPQTLALQASVAADALDAKELRQARIEGFLKKLGAFEGDKPEELPRPNQFGLEREHLQSDVIRPSIKEIAQTFALNGQGRCCNRLTVDYFPADQKQALVREFAGLLAAGGHAKALDSILSRNMIEETFCANPEYQSKAKLGLIAILANRDRHEASFTESVELLRVSSETLSEPEVQEAMKRFAEVHTAENITAPLKEILGYLAKHAPDAHRDVIQKLVVQLASAGKFESIPVLTKGVDNIDAFFSSEEYQLAAAKGITKCDMYKHPSSAGLKEAALLLDETLAREDVQKALTSSYGLPDKYRRREMGLRTLGFLQSADAKAYLAFQIERDAMEEGDVRALQELRKLEESWANEIPELGSEVAIDKKVSSPFGIPKESQATRLHRAQAGFFKCCRFESVQDVSQSLKLFNITAEELFDQYSQMQIRSKLEARRGQREDLQPYAALGVIDLLIRPEDRTNMVNALAMREISHGETKFIKNLIQEQRLSLEFVQSEPFQTMALQGFAGALGTEAFSAIEQLPAECHLTDSTLHSAKGKGVLTRALVELASKRSKTSEANCVAAVEAFTSPETRSEVLEVLLPAVVKNDCFSSFGSLIDKLPEARAILDGPKVQEVCKQRLLERIRKISAADEGKPSGLLDSIPLLDQTVRDEAFVREMHRALAAQGANGDAAKTLLTAINELVVDADQKKVVLCQAYLERVRTGNIKGLDIWAKDVGITDQINDAFLASSDYQAAALEGVVQFLEFKHSKPPRPSMLHQELQQFHLLESTNESDKYKNAVIACGEDVASKGWYRVVPELLQSASRPEWRAELVRAMAISAAKKAEIRTLKSIETESSDLASACFLEPAYQEAAIAGSKAWLRDVEHESALKIRKLPSELHLSASSLKDQELQKTVEEFAVKLAAHSQGVATTALLETFVTEELRSKVARALVPTILLSSPITREQKAIVTAHLKDYTPRELENELPQAFLTLSLNHGFQNFEQLVEFLEKNPEFHQFIAYQKSQEIRLRPADMRAASKFGLHLAEAEELIRQDFDLQRAAQQDDVDAVVQALFDYSSAWSDKETVQKNFLAGVEAFGAASMLRFSRSKFASRHDALQGFSDVLKLYQQLERQCGISKLDFQRNILDHVNRDGGTYTEGRSFHHLNAIARSSYLDIEKTLAEARAMKSLQRIGELVETFDDHRVVASDWKHLKRFAKLQRTLAQRDAFERISNLRASADVLDIKDADWIETVAFHPDSNVSLEAVLKFSSDPKAFLSEHGSTLETALAPGNYCTVEHLDLDYGELARAYRTGQLDKFQSLPSMAITFTIPNELENFSSTREALDYALGSQASGDGQAKQVKKLYHQVKHLLPKGVDIVQYLHGEEVPREIEQQIEQLLFDSKVGLREQPRKFRAVVHKASSPEGSIAGDDTACCMPFGSAKNTHYMFNPNCSFFTVQIEKPDGGWRTIAQTVLEIDRETGVPFPELREGIKDGWGISQVLDNSILRDGENYLEGDNIEMARNYRTEWKGHISAVYKSFMRTYIQELQKCRPVSTEEMPIGQGYTDSSLDLEKRDNSMCKIAPTSYTDNSAQECYSLSLKERPPFIGEVTQPFDSSAPWSERFEPGVSDLTYRDILQASYINDLAFPHQSPYYDMFRLQNAIIGKDYNNHLKGRENLSLRHINQDGKFTGYLLAYHGKLDEEVRSQAHIKGEQEVIFLSLIAGHPQHADAAGPLLSEFIKRYREHYLDKGNPLPLLTELREGTTYDFAKARLKRLTRSLGAGYEMVEVGEVKIGEENVHRVMIVPSHQVERYRAMATLA